MSDPRVAIGDRQRIRRDAITQALACVPSVEVASAVTPNALIALCAHLAPSAVVMEPAFESPALAEIAASLTLRRVVIYPTSRERAVPGHVTPDVLLLDQEASGRDLVRAALDPGPAADLVPTLTRREIAVLRLAHRGMSVRQIAGAALMSEGTVKTHLRHVYAKFGVHTRTEAVHMALSLGLLVVA